MNTEIAVPEYKPTTVALNELRTRLAGVVYDVTTGKGMDIAKKDRAELRDLRVTLEKKRVELKAPALERSRLIDAEAKRVTGEIVALEDPIDQAIKAEEGRKEAERQAKIDAERERIAAIERERIAMEQAEAERIRAEQAAAMAAERAELDRQRAEFAAAQAEQEKVARAERERQESVLRAERDAHKAKLAAERKAAADEQAKADEAARLERKRIADEREALERQQAEQRKRDAEAAATKAEQDRKDAQSKRLANLKANAPALTIAAVEAYNLLQSIGQGDNEITITLGFAIEHNAKASGKRKAA